MSSDQYLLERAPRTGSSSHYAIRMGRDPMQSLALYVLCRELFAISAIAEESVAQTKLAWWRQELGGLNAIHGARPPNTVAAGSASNIPAHPLSQALLTYGFGQEAAINSLGRMIDAIDVDLTQSRFLDESALNRYLDHAAAAPAAALAHARGLDAAAALAAAHLGHAVGRARLLMDVGRDARQQRIYLPHDLLKSFNVPAADILKGRATPALKTLAQSVSARIEDDARAALQNMSAADKKELRSLKVYAALTLARLREVAKDGYQIATHRLSVTPIRKLAIAWRTTYLAS